MAKRERRSERNSIAGNRGENKEKKSWVTALKIGGCVILALAAVYAGLSIYVNSRTMGSAITIFGKNVSWKTADQAADLLESEFEGRKVIFRENGQEIYDVSLGAAGYSLNEEELKQKLDVIKANRPSGKLFFEESVNYTVDYQVERKEDALRQAVAPERFGGNEGRQESVDAYIAYDEGKSAFVIVDSVTGTKIDVEKASRAADAAIAAAIQEELLGGAIYVDVTEEFYQDAAVTEEQEDLKAQLEGLNAKLNGYLDMVLTYEFGNETEVVDRSVISQWVQVDGLEISLDENAIWAFVEELGARYNTIYVPRYFRTSRGNDIVIDQNEYGYWVDEEGEFARLMQDLETGGSISREPVYSHAGFNRNGEDDLAGNYVELDLTAQHLWLYRDGELITETDVVTGKPQGVNNKTGELEDWSTIKGAFSIAYKESPSTLSSDIYGYEVKVQYWMPFVLGQGLHDASWQTSFGGDRYITNGSHGCVNLSLEQAAIIYEHVDAGFPIIIY